MSNSPGILKNKKFLIPFIILLVLIFIFILYILESRFFLIGKILHPAYAGINNAFSNNYPGYSPDYPESADYTDNDEDIYNKNYPETIVYCDYYTWHNAQNWQRGYSDTPVLGFYDSLDPKVISEHLKWARDYGIDVLKIEYFPQLDESIINGIFSADTGKTYLCLMYDSRLRFENTGFEKPPYDFDNPEIKKTFMTDISHIAATYFWRENYFKINGKPVLWIYVTRDFTGGFKETIKEAREELLKKGYEVYLVGDHVFWNYKFYGIRAFDAVSCYSAYAGRPQNTALFAERLKFLYMAWKNAAAIAGRDFIPSAIPGYDDTCLENERKSLPVLSGTAEDFNYQLEVIKTFLDPVNISPGLTQASVATFNEHQEGTSVEPSQEWGFTRIEQISEVFGNN